MNTIKKLSSTLKTQLGVIGAAPSPQHSGGQQQRHLRRHVDPDDDDGDPRSRQDIAAACEKLLDSSTEGEVFFKTDGKFHSFVLRVEDAVVAALLEHFPPDDLQQATGAFITRAVQYCPDFDPMDSAYAVSHVGAIRSSVRAIASKEPGRILDHVDAIFATVSAACGVGLTNLKDDALRRDSQCLRKLSHAQLSYLPLRDDPFANVFNPALPLPPPSSSSSSSSSSSAALPSRLRVTGCGSDEVQGVYVLAPRRGGDRDAHRPPEYRHPAGYVITRTKKALSVRWDDAPDGDGVVGAPPALVVFEWTVSNPPLATAYYCCCTPDPTMVPPALGWRQAGPLGRLPGPQLAIADADPPDERDEIGQSTLAGASAAAVAPPPFRAPVVPVSAAASKPQGARVKGKAKAQAFAEAADAGGRGDTGTGRGPSRGGGALAALQRHLELDTPTTPAALAKALGHAPAAGGPGGRAPTDAALQQLRQECEAMLSGGEGAGQLHVLLGKCRGAETALKQKAAAIAQKIEWLGVADTDELVDGLLASAAGSGAAHDEERNGSADGKDLPPPPAAAARRHSDSSFVAPRRLPARHGDSSSRDPDDDHDGPAANANANANAAWGDVAVRLRPRGPNDATPPPPPPPQQPASPPSPSPRDRRALVFPIDVGSNGNGNSNSNRNSGRFSQSPARSNVWPAAAATAVAAGGASPSRPRRSSGSDWGPGEPPASPHTPRRGRRRTHHPHHLDGSPARDADTSLGNDSADSSVTAGAFSGLGWGGGGGGGSVVSSSSSFMAAAAMATTGLERRSPFAVGGLASVSADDTAPRIQKFCSTLMDLAFERTGRGANTYADVEVLGVEVRKCQPGQKQGPGHRQGQGQGQGPGATVSGGQQTPRSVPGKGADADERVHYVIRASMREYLYAPPRAHQHPQSQSQSQSQPSPGSAVTGANASVEPRRRSASSSSSGAGAAAASTSTPGVLQQQPRLVFTVRRDLPSLCAFHAELVEALHELRASADWPSLTAPAFPDAFALGTGEEQLLARHTAVAAAAGGAGGSGGLGFLSPSSWGGGGGGAAAAAAQAFAYTSRFRATWMQKLRGKGVKPKEGLLAAPPAGKATSTTSTAAAAAAAFRVEDSVDTAAGQLQTYIRAVFAIVEAADERAAAAPDQHAVPAALGRLVGRFLLSADEHADGAASAAAAAAEPYTQQQQEGRGRRQARRPCWHAHASGGLALRLTVSDDFGGRLSSHSDDEQLKAQRGRCLGCGEPISAGFLGFLDRNYQPCRYLGGLFCRKWCHGDDYRHIPHRLLRHWDHVPHRVSRPAAAFLDRLWRRPLLLVGTINPLLHEGLGGSQLRLVKNMRRRALQHVVHILDADFDGEADALRDAVLALLGPGRVHLCLADDLYAVADLVAVHNRDMPPVLERLLQMLRNKDRHGGPGAGSGGPGYGSSVEVSPGRVARSRSRATSSEALPPAI